MTLLEGYLWELAMRIEDGGEKIQDRLDDADDGHDRQLDRALSSLRTVEKACSELRERLEQRRDGHPEGRP